MTTRSAFSTSLNVERLTRALEACPESLAG
jgi:hypothetical protein